MFDFGDELIIESYKIPWLIWIQLLATILFIILLFGISVCTSDSAASSASTSISASTSTGRAAIAPPPNLNDPSSSQRVKVSYFIAFFSLLFRILHYSFISLTRKLRREILESIDRNKVWILCLKLMFEFDYPRGV